jgi:thiamine biosynthesis lipoprotein
MNPDLIATEAPGFPSAGSPPIVPPAARERLGEARWETWSTSVVLRLSDPRGLRAARIAVERELDAIDRACSRFRPDSEIERANASAGRTVRVSPLLAEALALALRAARMTDGDVDPTVGSALMLAGYDRDWLLLEPAPAQAPPRDPSTHEHPAAPMLVARAVCGWRSVMFDSATRALRIPAGFTIDLGATAKAWAADRAAHTAARTAGCGALVAIGGDIATDGPAPTGGWAVHVTDDHRSDHHAPGQTVTIHSGGLATSSTAVRRWRHRGRTMHHIIDPATGAPKRGTWRTVSVAAASCADANIATTAALIRAGAAPAWLARMGLPARLVNDGGRVYTIGAWPAYPRRTQIPVTPQPRSRAADHTPDPARAREPI